jgi:hypothetical protein
VNRDGELAPEEFITGLACLTQESTGRKLEFVFNMLDRCHMGRAHVSLWTDFDTRHSKRLEP